MLLYLSIAILAVLGGLLVYRYDLYDKEPLWMLLLTAAAGLVVMWGNGRFQLFLLSLLAGNKQLCDSVAAYSAKKNSREPQHFML